MILRQNLKNLWLNLIQIYILNLWLLLIFFTNLSIVKRVKIPFVKRRGVDSQKETEVKLFNFRNETGMCIAYVLQTSENCIKDISPLETLIDLKAYKHSAIKKVNDGEEACFNTDPMKSDDFELSFSNSPDAFSRDRKKVRTYGGQFPFLSVLIQPFSSDVDVEILRDVSVVKSGQHLKRPHKQKIFKRQQLIDDTEEGNLRLVLFLSCSP